MTNYRLVVAAVSIPTITAIFGLLWFWDRKKKKELARNDTSSTSEGLNKNTNSFSESCSSLYEALSEPLNNGTNSIAVISGNDDDEDDYSNQRIILGKDWIQKINSTFLSNDSEDGINSESKLHVVNKTCIDVADQDSEEFPNVGSEADSEIVALPPSISCENVETELCEAQTESKILFSCPPPKQEETPCVKNVLVKEKDEGDERKDGEAEIVENNGKEVQEKDLIPEVKNELPMGEDVSKIQDVEPLLNALVKDDVEEELAKDNSAQLLTSNTLEHKELQHSVKTFEKEDEEENEETVLKELTSEDESEDRTELPGSNSNGYESEKNNSLLDTLDGNEAEIDRREEAAADTVPEVKNGHYQELLVSEVSESECESTNPAFDSLNGNYEEEESEELVSALENGTGSEAVTSDGYVSGSERTYPYVDDDDHDHNDSKESSLDDEIKLSGKPIDVISAMFSGGQLNDSQLKADLVHLEAQATKMSTPNHATSVKLLSHAKQLFNETDSATPPETDSDTYLSSKELMSETLESDQTDLSLTPNPSNQSDEEENQSSSPLSSSPQGEQENQLDSLDSKFLRNDRTGADVRTSSPVLDEQHGVEDIAESEDSNSELSQKKSSSLLLDKSSNSDLSMQTDNLEQEQQQHHMESSSESKTLLPSVEDVAEHSTENTIIEENSEKEIENINKDVSQSLGKGLESESNRTLNDNSSLKTLAVSQSSLEATKTLDENLCNAHDSTHKNKNNNNNNNNTNNNSAHSREQERHQFEPNTVIKAESGPEKTSPPKEQRKPDSVLSSNCDAKNTKSSDINKMAVKTKSSTLYEFYFPSELCGRLIGRQGKNIIHIKERSGASVSLQPSPYTPNHQICTIEGTQIEIDEALKCISQKFPNSIYPNVDLTAITDSTQLASSPVVVPDLIQLSLPPEGVSIDVLVASIVDGGHLFLQLPTHPTYAALERLNQFMNRCYSQPGMVPQLPRPLTVGVICAAPVMEGWYRAVIVAVSEETDECEIKFVDYGGFSRVPGNLLRQIRSDFMTLPFQAIEAYLANITPLQNENYFSERAVEILQELTENGMLQAQVVSRAEDGTPYVHIYQINGNKVTFVNRELVNRGAVRWIEVL